MKTILFVDLNCSFGHNNINKIYIDKLEKAGYNVELAMTKSYFENLQLFDKKLYIELPEKYFYYNSKLMFRINQYLLLILIKNKCKNVSFEFVFFSFFEETSFYFSRFSEKSYLMVHGNAENLFNKFKYYFLSKISRRTVINFLVFSDDLKRLFNSKNIYNVIVSQHGCPKPLINSVIVKNQFKNFLRSINCIHNDDKFLFIPNANKFGNNFIYKLLLNIQFLDYINLNKINIIIKHQKIDVNSDRIYFIPNSINNNIYNSILLNSYVILLNYPDSFQYRVSGIFFECIANDKPMILSNITSFNSFNEVFNYNPYYNSIDEICVALNQLLMCENNFYKNKAILEPNLNEL